jgi:hypothetical protein
MIESLTKSNADRTDKEKRISNNCEEAKTSLQYKLNPEKQGQKSDVTKEDQKLKNKFTLPLFFSNSISTTLIHLRLYIL